LTRVRSLPDALGHKTPSKSLPGAWWGFLNKAPKIKEDRDEDVPMANNQLDK
jgi:hypothetical protein